jgi:hypothetical protein
MLPQKPSLFSAPSASAPSVSESGCGHKNPAARCCPSKSPAPTQPIPSPDRFLSPNWSAAVTPCHDTLSSESFHARPHSSGIEASPRSRTNVEEGTRTYGDDSAHAPVTTGIRTINVARHRSSARRHSFSRSEISSARSSSTMSARIIESRFTAVRVGSASSVSASSLICRRNRPDRGRHEELQEFCDDRYHVEGSLPNSRVSPVVPSDLEGWPETATFGTRKARRTTSGCPSSAHQ